MNTTAFLGPLRVPDTYPVHDHLRVHDLVRAFAQHARRPDEYVAELQAALQGAAYRYCACREAYAVVTGSAAGFDQDRDLFHFIANGHAVIESLAYAAYAAGATFWPQVFPFASDAARRAVSGRATARAYDLAGSADFAAQLHALLDSADFRAWTRYRNVLTHRALGEGAEFTAAAAEGMLRWLEGTLGALMAALVRLAEGQRPHDITLT